MTMPSFIGFLSSYNPPMPGARLEKHSTGHGWEMRRVRINKLPQFRTRNAKRRSGKNNTKLSLSRLLLSPLRRYNARERGR
jgi:hypothetical protein